MTANHAYGRLVSTLDEIAERQVNFQISPQAGSVIPSSNVTPASLGVSVEYGMSRVGIAKRKVVYRIFHRALLVGIVDRADKCSRCGKKDLEGDRLCGHHWNYDKPLEVEWACKVCHAYIHIQEEERVIVGVLSCDDLTKEYSYIDDQVDARAKNRRDERRRKKRRKIKEMKTVEKREKTTKKTITPKKVDTRSKRGHMKTVKYEYAWRHRRKSPDKTREVDDHDKPGYMRVIWNEDRSDIIGLERVD